jgi:DNA-binding beta-propeller fold protein YncE
MVVPARSGLSAQTSSGSGTTCELCLYGPDNIVFDSAGHLYITDTDHKSRFRVVKVSSAGKLIDEWHVFDGGQNKAKGPEGIAIDHDGNILVTDAGTLSVLRISPAGKVLGRIGGDEAGFEDLGHVVVDASGYIYVSEAGPNRIQKFSPSGKRVGVWKRAKGSGPEQWDGIETIAVRGDGTFVVEDWRNHRIVVLSASGQTLFSFGSAGDGPGQFATQAGLGVDSAGNIYAADWKLHRIQKFDPTGHLLFTFAADGSAALFREKWSPAGVSVDAHDNVFTVDGLTIVKLSPTGRLLERWR